MKGVNFKMAIGNVIKSIQDIMRQDAGVDGDAQRISQLVWMIFLKVYDAKEEEWEIREDDYKSAIPENLRWRSWASNDEGITGDDLLNFINENLFKILKELSIGENDDPKGLIVKSVFEDSYNYMKSGTLMRQVINKLNEIDFNSNEDRHLFNDIYENILKDLQNAGNAGEYYTPRAVTQFIIDIINPQVGEVVLDPACGTGGFLVCALKHLRNQVTNIDDKKILESSILGMEKKPLPHLLCTTNLILNDIDVPQIKHDNSLGRNVREYTQNEKVDIIITNPPFGGTEEDGIDVNFPKEFQTKETADLFLVLIMYRLKKQGRAAVVLPDGFLFGEGVKTKIKEKLLSEFNLHTIVRMPNGVFAPYTGINTNLLFFEKGEPTKEVWFYEHQLPEGYKNYTKTKPIRIEEFNIEKEWWNKRKENSYAWKVSADEIKKRNYNLDYKNPNNQTEELIHSTDELIIKIEKNLGRSMNLLDELKGVLSNGK
jgi:type I restriction enzyme M protein